MPRSEVPVLRQRFEPGDALPYWCAGQKARQHCLYDLDQDPDENENLVGAATEREMLELLHAALTGCGSTPRPAPAPRPNLT